ncbi:hypothetical protein [uncultured Pantoea sp.]|uniref:hypothetical protein n=1 Tax=uncultured Pantoea sp. TaxID=218084 RepID=UPI0025F19198|nr:hypothetical protein [uncultured Pantoea sp.]
MMNKLSNKELVAAGHKFAANLDADTPLIDRAKMVSELATRLDVALAAATEAGKQRDALAAEGAELKELYRESVKELDDTYFEMGMMRGEKSMEYPAPETPATDAILNAVRAEGIQIAIDTLKALDASPYAIHSLECKLYELRAGEDK